MEKSGPAVPRRRARVNVPLIAAAAATIACALLYVIHLTAWSVPGVDALERTSADARFRLRGGRAPADDRIVIVGVDDDTRRAFPETTQFRRGWAQLIAAIAAHRPKVIALDIFYASPERILRPALAARVLTSQAELATTPAPAPEALAARAVLDEIAEELRGDAVLAEAIADAGTVYLGVFFHLVEAGEALPTGPVDEEPGARLARYGESVVAGGDTQPPLASAATATLEAIGARAAGAGAVNVYTDGDGVTRRMPGVIQHGDRHYLPLGLAVAMAEQGTRDARYVGGQAHATIGGRALALGRRADLQLDFLGPNRTFPRISAATILDGTAPDDALAGKLVFVGVTYGAVDKVATPYDALTDGVELHATLAHNILHDELIRPGGRGLTLGAILALGLAITGLQVRRVRRRPWVPAVGAAMLVAGWCVISYQLFARQRLLVDMVAPMLAGLLITATGAIAVLATEGREKARLRQAFSQYVSATLVERILATPGLAHLGGERRELTVLFSDIRGFSRFAETLEPEALAAFLNDYLTPMTELVLDSSGTLDKYIGDAVMAIWGAPVELPDHPSRACATALAMIERLGPLNDRWRRDGLPQIRIGVGINTGAMAVGNMGSEARFDYTVLGDAVNLAARLEALTREYDVDALCGEATARAAGDAFVFRELDWVRLTGRDGVVAVHQLLGRKGAVAEADLACWRDALAAYRARDFARAAELWGDLALRAGPAGDGAPALMRARAEALRADPPGDDWDGVYAQKGK